MTAFTTAALTSELNTDPLALGYAPLKVVADDLRVATKLNALTGPGAANVFRNDITAREIINAIAATDFAVMTTLQLQKLQLMTAQGIIDATTPNTRTIFLGIFTGMASTITALTALASRPGSRAEVLWGTGTVITASQIGAAR